MAVGTEERKKEEYCSTMDASMILLNYTCLIIDDSNFIFPLIVY